MKSSTIAGTTKATGFQRAISWIMAVVMAVSLMPLPAYAAGSENAMGGGNSLQGGSTSLTTLGFNTQSVDDYIYVPSSGNTTAAGSNANQQPGCSAFGSNSWKNNFTEFVYLQSEVGSEAKTITSVSWYTMNSAARTETPTSFKVYMGLTSQTSIAQSSLVDADKMTLVYEGTPTFQIYSTSGGQWIELELAKGFAYPGTSGNNLVVAIVSQSETSQGLINTANQSNSGKGFVAWDDDNAGYFADYSSAITNVASMSKKNNAKNRPSIRLGYGEAPASEKTSVAIPTAAENLTASDEPQTLITASADADKYMLTCTSGNASDVTVSNGGATAVKAGTYEFTATLNDTETCQWSDTTTDAKTFTVTIAESGGGTPAAQNTFAVDNPEKVDGKYIITTTDDLMSLAERVNASATNATYKGESYKLAADIDLSDKEWVAIGASSSLYFNGSLDGDGHSISNLKTSSITSSSTVKCGGLFGYVSLGNNLNDVTIENLKLSGSITSTVATASSNTVGGLIGYPTSTYKTLTVKNCIVDVDIDCAGAAGGLLGNAPKNLTIENCLVEGDLVNAGVCVGGFIGNQGSFGTGPVIKNSLYTGQITTGSTFSTQSNNAKNAINGLIGRSYSGKTANDLFSNAYYLAQTDTNVKSYRPSTNSADNYQAVEDESLICSLASSTDFATAKTNLGDGWTVDGTSIAPTPFAASDGYVAESASPSEPTKDATLAAVIDSNSLKAGSTNGTITVTYNGDGVVSAASSDSSIASVGAYDATNHTFTVTPKAEGAADITVSAAAGSEYKAATDVIIRVTVSPADKMISVIVTAGPTDGTYVLHDATDGIDLTPASSTVTGNNLMIRYTNVNASHAYSMSGSATGYQDKTEAYDFSTVTSSSASKTFSLSRETYTITYNDVPEGVTNSNPISYYVNTPNITLKDPGARDGFTFVGWFTDENCTQAATAPAIAKGSTGNKTFWAKWDANPVIKNFKVTFVDEDGTTVLKETAEYAEGTAAADIAKPADPAKASTAEYDYTFAGWTPEIASVTADATYKATYTATKRSYTVKFMNGEETLQSTQVEYGQTPTYTGSTPTKAADSDNTYAFKGWTPEIAPVTGEATYTAEFTATPIEKPVTETFKVTFVDEDGTTVLKEAAEYAEDTAAEDIVKPADPAKASTAEYDYTFTGWTPEISDVTADATYKATYTAKKRSYTVTFKNGSKTLQSTKVEYGKKPTYNGQTPTKAADSKSVYKFKGWAPALKAVTGNATYTAEFTAVTKVAKPASKSYTYDGTAKVGVAAGEGYTLTGTAKATNVGTYSAKAKLDAGYVWSDGSSADVSLTWKVNAASIAKATIAKTAAMTYAGKALTPAPKVTLSGKQLTLNKDYTLSYAGNKNAGTATITVTGKGNYTGTAKSSFTIKKAASTLSVKVKKTLLAKAKASKTTFKASDVWKTVKNVSGGALAYKKASGDSKISVASNGKVTVKKGLKKGKTYTVKVKVTSKATSNYNAASNTVSLKVKVK